MIWSWVDGHLILAAIACPIIAYLAVGITNHLIRVWHHHQIMQHMARHNPLNRRDHQ